MARWVPELDDGVLLNAAPARIQGIAGVSPTTPLAFTAAHDARQFQFALKLFW